RAGCALLAALLAWLPALRASAARRWRPTTVVVVPYAALNGTPGALTAKATALVTGELKGREELMVVDLPAARSAAAAAPEVPRRLLARLQAGATAHARAGSRDGARRGSGGRRRGAGDARRPPDARRAGAAQGRAARRPFRARRARRRRLGRADHRPGRRRDR